MNKPDMNNFEEWEGIYKPIPNHIDKQGTYYADENGVNYSFETFGEELKYINKQDERYIWTLCEEDGVEFIQNGKWLINRLAYLVCKNPCFKDRGTVSWTLYDPNEDQEDS